MIGLVIAVMLMRPTPTAPAPAATAGTAAAARAKSAKAQAQSQGPVAPVKLSELSARRDEPGDAKRNPFEFYKKPAPPPPPAPPTKAPTPPTEPIRTGPPPPPPLPPITLKLIGVLERANGVKWAVLSDGKASTPMYGKDGDIIDGRYQILKIGTESIEMTYVDGRGRTVIRLTGQ